MAERGINAEKTEMTERKKVVFRKKDYQLFYLFEIKPGKT